MSFERVRTMKGGKGTKFASIDKQGRMIIPHAVATIMDGVKPGSYFELLVDRDECQILLRPCLYETAYSVKATCTGKVSAWDEKDESGRTPNLIVSVKTALTLVGFSIVSRLRVPISWSSDFNGFIVQLPKPELVTSELAKVGDEVKA